MGKVNTIETIKKKFLSTINTIKKKFLSTEINGDS